jgi:hypothetical protein
MSNESDIIGVEMVVEVDSPKMRISDFAVKYVVEEIDEGWLTCEVEILDEDGEAEKSFTAKSLIGLGEDGGYLRDSRHNEELDDERYASLISEAMEQYLDHPDVKKEISDEHIYALEQQAEFEDDEAA